MYVGDKSRINISSSQFTNFIENGCLYVDKTAFVEHVLQDASDVLLFTRPRRMGKSLNMNTLATFLDCKRDTAHLFAGLYIEHSPMFEQVNSHPVVYLDFVNLDSSDLAGLRQSFRMQIKDTMDKYLQPDDIRGNLKDYADNPTSYSPSILNPLLKAIAEKYQKEPYLIIDEYDKIIMDTLNHREGDEIKA
ncbi:MAG: AAA family ATPase, partial [Oscillospiraceae bacterium]|nr:AAA family ATPase [Oscillospiraceae bacterium]